MVPRKVKLFVSLDLTHDTALGDFWVEQSQRSDSPFEVIGCSVPIDAPGETLEILADQIRSADGVVIVVGPHTHNNLSVQREVDMARDYGKPVCQVMGYREVEYPEVPGAGRLYRWHWENLKRLLATWVPR